jgi:hypothetical protein
VKQHQKSASPSGLLTLWPDPSSLAPRLAFPRRSSHSVVMTWETLGDAFSQVWGVSVRCAHGREDGAHSKSSRKCIGRSHLDIETLVWTRGPAFLLSRLNSRLKCPRRGSRYVVVMFQPPCKCSVRAMAKHSQTRYLQLGAKSEPNEQLAQLSHLSGLRHR